MKKPKLDYVLEYNHSFGNIWEAVGLTEEQANEIKEFVNIIADEFVSHRTFSQAVEAVEEKINEFEITKPVAALIMVLLIKKSFDMLQRAKSILNLIAITRDVSGMAKKYEMYTKLNVLMELGEAIVAGDEEGIAAKLEELKEKVGQLISQKETEQLDEILKNMDGGGHAN